MATWPDLTSSWDAGSFDKDAGDVLPLPCAITQVGPLVTLREGANEVRGKIGEVHPRSGRVEVVFTTGARWFDLAHRRLIDRPTELRMGNATGTPQDPRLWWAIAHAVSAAARTFAPTTPALPPTAPFDPWTAGAVDRNRGERTFEHRFGTDVAGVTWRIDHTPERALSWGVARSTSVSPYLMLALRPDGALTLDADAPLDAHEELLMITQDLLAPWLIVPEWSARR